MGDWTDCPLCAAAVHNSYNGWARHTSGPRHQFVAMGLSPDDAERVIIAAADAGIEFDQMMAAVREVLAAPPEECARIAAELRALASTLSG